MGPIALFGITNDGVNLVVNLLVLFLVVLWIALVWWTYADARRRIEDPMIQSCAAAASLFPFLGTVVYLVVRPPEYLEDVRERELEIAAAEARLTSAQHTACPYCSNAVEASFLRCPNCMHRLKEPCDVCAKPLDPRWRICPYCEAEVGSAQQQAPRRERPRRRQPAAAEQPTQAAEAAPRRAAAQRPAREEAPRREAAAKRAAPARQPTSAPSSEPSRPARAQRTERPAGEQPRERPAGDRARQ